MHYFKDADFDNFSATYNGDYSGIRCSLCQGIKNPKSRTSNSRGVVFWLLRDSSESVIEAALG